MSARLALVEPEETRLLAELKARYPWAKTTKHGSPDTAKNIKAELTQIWPAVKFSVVTDHPGSIRVRWTDGPSDKQVEEVVDKYESGHFDGMVDSYEYDRSAYGKAVDAVLGRVRYVFTVRHTSDALIQKAIDRVAKEYSRTAELDVTVERFKAGDLFSLTPFEDDRGGMVGYWGFQSLIHRELSKMGMMPVQVTK